MTIKPDIAEVQSRVSAVEALCGMCPSNTHRWGIRVSDWFLPVGLAAHLLFPQRRVPINSERAFFSYSNLRSKSAWSAAVRPQLINWRTSADALALNTNIRSFYLSVGVTLKISCGQRDADARLRYERQVRERLCSVGSIKIPRMEDYRDAGGVAFITERIVSPAVVPEIAPLRLVANLLDFYIGNGARLRELDEVIDEPTFTTDVREFISCFGLEVAATSLLRTVSSMFDAARRWHHKVLWGVCHGDLSLGNMIAGSDGIYVVDWEWAHHNLVFSDFGKLFSAVEGFERAVSLYAERTWGSENLLPMQQQLFLAKLAYLTNLRRKLASVQLEPRALRSKLKKIIGRYPDLFSVKEMARACSRQS